MATGMLGAMAMSAKSAPHTTPTHKITGPLRTESAVAAITTLPISAPRPAMLSSSPHPLASWPNASTAKAGIMSR